MKSNYLPSEVIRLVVAVAGFAWIVSLWIFNSSVDFWDALKPFSAANAAAIVFWVLFNHFLWKWPWIREFISKSPDIRGSWEVEIEAMWLKEKQPRTPNKIRGYAYVHQTFSRYTIRIFTDGSCSETTSNHVDVRDERITLTYTYLNTPSIGRRLSPTQQSTRHIGTGSLNLGNFKPLEMEGEYWTEEMKAGNIRFFNRRDKSIAKFAEGEALYQGNKEKDQ